jgi:branched-chain amino acid transport system permease protein
MTALLAFDTALFVERMVNGLAEGSIFAMLALSLVVVFRSSGQLNFAQGEMGLFGAFLVSTLTLTGFPVWISIGIAMAVGFVLASGVERVIIRPIEHRNPGAVVVAAIGLFLGINQLHALIWGVDARRLPSPFPSDADSFFRLFGAPVRWERFGTFLVLLVLLAFLWVLFNKTKIGLAMRAVANNPESAGLVGIRVGWVLAIGWGLATAIAVLGASLLAPQGGLSVALMFGPFLTASAAATLGGLDSPVGAVVGGLLLGVLKAIMIGYIPFLGGDMVFTVSLGIILVVLLVRPGGLFGSVKVERV